MRLQIRNGEIASFDTDQPAVSNHFADQVPGRLLADAEFGLDLPGSNDIAVIGNEAFQQVSSFSDKIVFFISI